MRLASLLLIFGTCAAQAAEPVDGKTARTMLFPAGNHAVGLSRASGLDDAQLAIIDTFLKQEVPGFEPRYYGAVAASPDFFARFAADPSGAALSGLLQMTFDFHNPQSAQSAALRACEAARSGGEARCVIAAQILPRRWKPQPVQLSDTATQGFRAYRRGSGPKALAISPSTGHYAMAKGAGAARAALDRCNEAAVPGGSADCEIVIED